MRPLTLVIFAVVCGVASIASFIGALVLPGNRQSWPGVDVQTVKWRASSGVPVPAQFAFIMFPSEPLEANMPDRAVIVTRDEWQRGTVTILGSNAEVSLTQLHRWSADPARDGYIRRLCEQRVNSGAFDDDDAPFRCFAKRREHESGYEVELVVTDARGHLNVYRYDVVNNGFMPQEWRSGNYRAIVLARPIPFSNVQIALLVFAAASAIAAAACLLISVLRTISHRMPKAA